MKKAITLLLILLIVASSVVILFNWFKDTSTEVSEGETGGETTEELLNEVDGILLGEDDEVEIGEMI